VIGWGRSGLLERCGGYPPGGFRENARKWFGNVAVEAKYTFLKSEQVVWNERDEGKRSLQRKEQEGPRGDRVGALVGEEERGRENMGNSSDKVTNCQ
jgi:hypothetical protein